MLVEVKIDDLTDETGGGGCPLYGSDGVDDVDVALMAEAVDEEEVAASFGTFFLIKVCAPYSAFDTFSSITCRIASRFSHDCALIIVFSRVTCWFIDISPQLNELVVKFIIISAEPPSTVDISFTDEPPEKHDDSFGS